MQFYQIKKKYKTVKGLLGHPLDWPIEVYSLLVRKSNSGTDPADYQSPAVLTNPRIEPLLKLANKTPIKAFSVDAKRIHESKEQIHHALKEHGVCVIEDMLDRREALSASAELDVFLTQYEIQSKLANNAAGYGEQANFIWQTDNAWSDDYLEIASSEKPILSIRSRDKQKDDGGMIDLFNVQAFAAQQGLHALHGCIQQIRNSVLSKYVSELSGYAIRQSNLYINEGVTQTRGPHIDNNSDPFKIFLYLSDVLNDDDGPYCYLPGSTKNRRWMTKERLNNANTGKPTTEVSSFPRDKMTKLFAKAGSVIITNQSGIHCGWPQSHSARRKVVVTNFY